MFDVQYFQDSLTADQASQRHLLLLPPHSETPVIQQVARLTCHTLQAPIPGRRTATEPERWRGLPWSPPEIPAVSASHPRSGKRSIKTETAAEAICMGHLALWRSHFPVSPAGGSISQHHCHVPLRSNGSSPGCQFHLNQCT